MKEWAKALFVSSLAALSPVHSVMIVVGVLITIDLITGIWAAVKENQQIKSSRLRDTVTKMLIFQMAVITGFLLEKYLIYDIIPISKIVAGVIGATEATSIFENLNKISGKDLFKELISRLGSKNRDVQ